VLLDRERRLAILSGVFLSMVIAMLATAYGLGMRTFNPERMMLISLGIAICVFTLNLTIAATALWRSANVLPTYPSP
jgi:hypothetical protein